MNMKYYSHRTGKNYSKDLNYAFKKGLVDTDDVMMLSREFAIWAPSLIDIAKKRNMEDASVGILSRNDIIQIASNCFLIAWRRVDWGRINNTPVDERRAALWGFIKANIELDLPKYIRRVKDGVRIPDREMFKRADMDKHELVLFDAITVSFPQLKLEMEAAQMKEDETSWNNYRAIGILQSHFRKFIKNDKHIFVLERSMGIDGDEMSSKEISDRLGTSTNNVDKMRSRALKTLKSEESMRELAFTLDGALIQTGANIAEFLK